MSAASLTHARWHARQPNRPIVPSGDDGRCGRRPSRTRAMLRAVHGALRLQVRLRATQCRSELFHQPQQVQVFLLEDLSTLDDAGMTSDVSPPTASALSAFSRLGPPPSPASGGGCRPNSPLALIACMRMSYPRVRWPRLGASMSRVFCLHGMK
jgi:hypothetical protein